MKTRSCASPSLPCTTQNASSPQDTAALPALPQLFQEPIHFSHSRSWNRGKCTIFANKNHFLAFVHAKGNSEITSACSYRLPKQAAAVKKQVHISVSWLLSFIITVSQDLTHAAKTGITDRELWEVLRIYYTKSGDLSLWCWAFQRCEQVRSVVCLSRALSRGRGTHKPHPTRSCPSQPSPSRTHMGHRILHGCKSKAQSCSSKESTRIFAFGIFMETGSCPKHIPRE